jgi:hypothetical protein
MAETPSGGDRLPDEERARRLKIEVERLALLPAVEWRFYLDDTDIAEKHGISKAALKGMVVAVIRENEKKAREDKADERYEQRRAEQKQEREDKRTRQDEARALKETERERKEADRIAREEEAKCKKREIAFAEIADLPKLTHQVRLREAADLGEDFEILVQEFEVYLAARTIPEELEPWAETVRTAELLAAIEAKFRRYIVASGALSRQLCCGHYSLTWPRSRRMRPSCSILLR